MRSWLTGVERRWVALVAGTVVALMLVLFTWQLGRAVITLDRAGSAAPLLAQQLAAGDVESAEVTQAQLSEDARTARRMTDGPGWAVASVIPVVGDDLGALRVMARSLDRLGAQVLPDVLDVAEDLQLRTFSPQDGEIDLAAVERTAPVVATSRVVVDEVAADLRTIDTGSLFGRLRVPVRALQQTIAATQTVASAADAAGDLLPTMLGGEGTRRYLLLIQNNAEARSLGGIPGSFAIITARDGEITMGRQGSAVDIRQRSEPIVELTAGERAVFPDTLARDIRNVTFSPDFTRAAPIAAALAEEALDVEIDGVVSVDPVALSSLLTGLGPVELDDGVQLTAETAVAELLNGTYRRYPVDVVAQDEVFTDAARRIFDRFVSGVGNVQAVLESLVGSSRENRILVWSADAAEQERIEATGVAGLPPGGASAPNVGVYLNDATGAKMQFYLQSGSVLTARECVDDRQTMDVITTLRSTAPESGLSPSVTGLNPAVEPGDQQLNVRIVSPDGGSVTALEVDGERRDLVGGDLDGRDVAIVPVLLEPGGSVVVRSTVVSAPGQDGRPVLTTTPGIASAVNDVRSPSACG